MRNMVLMAVVFAAGCGGQIAGMCVTSACSEREAMVMEQRRADADRQWQEQETARQQEIAARARCTAAVSDSATDPTYRAQCAQWLTQLQQRDDAIFVQQKLAENERYVQAMTEAKMQEREAEERARAREIRAAVEASERSRPAIKLECEGNGRGTVECTEKR